MTRRTPMGRVLGLLLCWPLWIQAQGQASPNDDAPPAFEGISAWETYANLRTFDFTDMDPVDGPRRGNLTARARLGMRYNRLLNPNTLFDSDARIVALYRNPRPGDGDWQVFLEVKRLILRAEELFGGRFNYLELGRNRIRDDLSWLIDDDMDYLQGGIDRTLLDLDLGVASWLWNGRIGGDEASRDEDQNLESSDSHFAFARINHQWYYRHFVELSWFREHYRRPEDFETSFPNRIDELVERADLDWLTLKADGTYRRPKTEWEYWGVLSWQQGEERQQNESLGVDRLLDMDGQMGWEFGVVGRFSRNRYAVGLGTAGAQGDRNNDGLRYFRQPTVAKNKRRMLGVKRYRVFGEALAPSLANLRINSVWLGWAPSPTYWIEAGVHRYRQSTADDTVFYSRSDLKPNGNSKDIGTAVDLILGGSLGTDMDMQLKLGWFKGGDAFDSVAENDEAYRILLEINSRW